MRTGEPSSAGGPGSGTAPDERTSQPLSVGQWLALLVVVLFVGPLLISNLWGYLQTRRYLTSAAFRNTRDLAALEAAETADFTAGAAALVPSLLTGDARVRGLLAAATSPASPDAAAARDALAAHLAAAVSASGELAQVQVLSPTGDLIASSRGSVGGEPDLASAVCLQRGRTGVAVVGFDPGPGADPELLAAAPIALADRVIAVGCARFRFAIYQRLLATVDRRTAGARLYLIDRDRRVIATSVGGGLASGEVLPWLPAGPVDAAWSARGHLPGDGDFVVGYAPVVGPGWGVVVAVPLAATLADLESLKWQAVGLFIGLMAVVALAMYLAWRTLIRPLRALVRTSEQIAGGAAGSTVVAAGPREIAELGGAFNRMSGALRESQQTLEDRIAARTRELRDSEQFLELLVNSIDQRVVVTDGDYRIVKANAAADRMHGRALVGERCYQVFEGRDAPCDDCPVAATFATGRPASAERSQHTIDGQQPMAITTYPIFGPDGAIESVVAISRVTSREKQMQAKLAFQEKLAAFGQLAAGVAHELGNPLASIDSQLQRAERDPSRAPASVAVVRKEVGRMSRMLRELVDFARRKRDEVRLTSPAQVVDDVLTLIEHDPRARNVELTRELAPDLPGVRLVEDQLVQVLLNLGLNALDALDQGGRLTFAARADGDHVELRVIDTGGGVAPEARDRLFEPFHSTKPAGRGTGLGLFVSKRIVEDMAGTLTLERTGPTGTTFLIRLAAGAARRPREDR